MTVRELATKDIKDELSKGSKTFIAFRRELDPVMEQLVEDHYILANH